jgi:tetratricopeptide (TPR) repeat protein
MRLLLCLFLILAMPALADPRADARKVELDRLLGALKAAPSEQAAGLLEARIKQIWLQSGSPAATLLLRRGDRDLQANAADEAVADYDAALVLEPGLTEAFNHRAVARFQGGDYTGALRDIEATLKREPRHFDAFQVLSRIAEARGDWAGALAAWQKALELDPRTPGGQERLNLLRQKAQGEAT